MASFSAFFQVGNKEYIVLYSNLNIHQFVDELVRPASPTFGGATTIEIDVSTDPTIPEWMFNPAAFKNAQLLLRNLTGGVEKVIKYYNAYCVGLTQSFDGTANAANFRWRFRLAPQAIAVGGLFHDNNWPAPEPIVDWDWSQMDAACHPERAVSKEPGLFSDIAHGVLDVVGMIPVVGELADGANALFYLAEGNKTDAALSAAAMIPIAGWAATGAKVVRKGMKIAGKAQALKKVTSKVNRAATALKAATKRAEKVVSYNTPFKPLNVKQKSSLSRKLNERTITKDEYKKLEWDRRFNNRRSRGVSRYWAEERKALRRGEPGTRNWSKEQRSDILKGKTPKHNGEPVEGHHKYNALDHPQLADDPRNIYPATKIEHLKRWHGGDFKNDTRGVPLDKNFPEEF